ncbi:MAG: TRAP-type C4-dicarboxylate transport system, large permease component, partial [uncultured Craurococcus sp.]
GTHPAARQLHPAAADRRAGRLLPWRRRLRHRALHGLAAHRGVPAARLRHERLFHAGDPLLHLRRRPDDARPDRRPAGGAGGRHGRASARRARAGEHRRRDLVRRGLRLGGRRCQRGRRGDDPADEGAGLCAGLCRQHHRQCRADRPADPAQPQHDPLRHRGRRGDQRGGSLHRRHRPRARDDALAHGRRLARGGEARLPAGDLSGLGDPGAADLQRHPRADADRHHLRRRPQRRLHRDGERLRRGDLCAAGGAAGLSQPELGGLRPRCRRGGADDGHGDAHHRHGLRLRLADGAAAGAGADGGADEGHHRRPADDAADHQHRAAAAWHLHGHGAADHDRHADLPAGREGDRYGPGAVRHRAHRQSRHRHHHATGRAGALRRLRGRQGLDVGCDEDLGALLCGDGRGADAGHLCAGAEPLAAGAVQV